MAKRLFLVRGLIFTGVMATMFALVLVRPLFYAHASWQWPAVSAQVLGISVQSKSAKLWYAYQINGVEYVGNNFAFLSEGTLMDRDIILADYRTGETIEVFVNPADESQSVVVRRQVAFEYVWVYLFIMGFCAFLFMRTLLPWRRIGEQSHGGQARLFMPNVGFVRSFTVDELRPIFGSYATSRLDVTVQALLFGFSFGFLGFAVTSTSAPLLCWSTVVFLVVLAVAVVALESKSLRVIGPSVIAFRSVIPTFSWSVPIEDVRECQLIRRRQYNALRVTSSDSVVHVLPLTSELWRSLNKLGATAGA